MAEDKSGDTALEKAEGNGNDDIAKLLLLHEIKVIIGRRIKQKENLLESERGSIDDIMCGLNRIGEQTAKITKSAFIEVMTTSIPNKSRFNDFMMSLCHKFIGIDQFEESELFKAIIGISDDIIKNGNGKDWVWFKETMILSNVKCKCMRICEYSSQLHHRFG